MENSSNNSANFLLESSEGSNDMEGVNHHIHNVNSDAHNNGNSNPYINPAPPPNFQTNLNQPFNFSNPKPSGVVKGPVLGALQKLVGDLNQSK